MDAYRKYSLKIQVFALLATEEQGVRKFSLCFFFHSLSTSLYPFFFYFFPPKLCISFQKVSNVFEERKHSPLKVTPLLD